ncbi:hypothetical protein [Hydrogenophaga defluvii]|uniref:Uncharacterized protein n=1 Tax=Hydrogenophaga defluvii TaxID=249410 RepID=A0ABW2SDE6_9BURK
MVDLLKTKNFAQSSVRSLFLESDRFLLLWANRYRSMTYPQNQSYSYFSLIIGGVGGCKRFFDRPATQAPGPVKKQRVGAVCAGGFTELLIAG